MFFDFVVWLGSLRVKDAVARVLADSEAAFEVPTEPLEQVETRTEYPVLLKSQTNLDTEIVALCLEECRKRGFKPGAVVAPSRMDIIKRMIPANWGIIVSNNIYVAGNNWSPLKVRWLNGSYAECDERDLILMIPVPDNSVLKVRAAYVCSDNH